MSLRAKRTWRIAGWALLATGLLVVADGVVTLTWKEPVTALVQSTRQNGLEDRLERVSLPAPPAIRDPGTRLAAQARALGIVLAGERMEALK